MKEDPDFADLAASAAPLSRPEHEAMRLLHELEVHQVELAAQNEELDAARAELAASLQRYVELYDFAPVALFTIDRLLNVREVNRQGCALLGVEPAAALGPALHDALDPAARRQLRRIVAGGAAAAARPAGELVVHGRHGARVLRVEGRPDPRHRELLRLALVDVTEARAHARRIEQMALHDPLTGLANRAQVMARLDQAITAAARGGTELALLLVDLDHFKTVNDTLGHLAGDELLRQAAQRLGATLGPRRLLGRLGGDEFVVLVPDAGGERELRALADQLLAAASVPFSLGGSDAYLTASVGVSRCPRDADEPGALLRYADIALYRAKDHGRNNAQFFEPEMDADATRRLRVRGQLHEALERGEFRLHYQPQVDARSGRVVGHEALVRWQHPCEGLVPPDRFVTIAEECGLILPIGQWVLEQAVQQALAWHRHAAFDGRVAVNVSTRQLERDGLAEAVGQVLARTGLPPHMLEIELTETAVMRDPEHAAGVLRAISRLGVGVAIDDFGVGHSSLSQLKRLPVQRLKIDRSFVAGLPRDEGDAAIVRAIAAMAAELGLEVVAEGVETAQQHDFLQRIGVCVMQGRLLGAPVAPA